MHKQIVKWTDFNDEEREQPFYFNLTKAELLRWETSHKGGMKRFLELIVEEKDSNEIFKKFEELIRISFGVRDADGNFIKRESDYELFKSSGAYDVLMWDLLTKDGAAAAFVQGVMPVVPQDHKEKAGS